MKYLWITTLMLMPALAQAAQWKVDPAQSHIRFRGEHAGDAFEGRFTRWQADIDFDADAPQKGRVKVEVDLTSATTGNATYDGTLKESDWLDSAKQSTATFESTTIRALDKKQYEAEGTLALRGHKVPLKLAFGLIISPDGTAAMQGTATLKRLDFGIGKESDAAGEWVSLEIPLDVHVVATPQ